MTRQSNERGTMTDERLELTKCVNDPDAVFDTTVQDLDRPKRRNPIGEDILGLYRDPSAAKAVIADIDLLHKFEAAGVPVPTFLEAGPREELQFGPHEVRAAIVTCGGLAPGLHVVVHSIVKRHVKTYQMSSGKVFGVYDSFRGLCDMALNYTELDPETTEEWLDHGGSKLGNVRTDKSADPAPVVKAVSTSLQGLMIDILYVIGGDGSLRMAHEIALANPACSVVGIPKTMDNDIMWVWQSFGFDTAVEQATHVINTLRREAESTRRVCIIELFGADSGFVAANAALASGHVDLVLIPEVFNLLTREQAEAYLEDCIQHLQRRVPSDPKNPHGVIVVAEGVGKVLQKKDVRIGAVPEELQFVEQLKGLMESRVRDARRNKMEAFFNQPRHNIRAVPANAHDHIYCDRLGALAVDNALAGFTDFMISQWLTEFVLVPLHLVGNRQKTIPIHGMFWKQVVSSTGQPLSPAEIPREYHD